MLVKILAAFALMALCVVIHALGVTSALRWVGRGKSARRSGFSAGPGDSCALRAG